MVAAWDSAAQGWHEQTPAIHAWLAPATARMLDRAALLSAAQVLDVAAGAGDQTLDVARRIGPKGSVLATDISAQFLQLAQANAQRAGFTNVRIKLADAQDLGLPPQSFDAAVCRLGLMFCTDVRAALAQVHAALRPGGHFSVIVFGPPHANPCVSIALATARRHAGMAASDPYAPGSLFSLSKPGCIEQLFWRAGFHHVAAETLDAVFRLPTTMDYLAFIRSSAGPLRQILLPLGPAAQERAWNQIARRLSVFQTPHGWQGPNQLLLCSGVVASAIL